MARADGLTPLLAEQFQRCEALCASARAFVAGSDIPHILDTCDSEATLIWMDDKTDVWCRGRIDVLSPDMILDIKTTSCDSPDAFMRTSMLQFGYHTQAEFYCRGMQACGYLRPRFRFLVIEDTPPHACYFVEPSPSMEALAQSQIERGLRLWAKCLATDEWPAYGTGVYLADAPSWALAREEEQL